MLPQELLKLLIFGIAMVQLAIHELYHHGIHQNIDMLLNMPQLIQMNTEGPYTDKEYG